MKINPKYIDKAIYERAFKEVNKQFKGRHGAYRSLAVLKRYKALNGRIDESKSSGGLRNWLSEQWKNLTPFSEGLAGKFDYPCGKKHPEQKGKSVCRKKADIKKYSKKQIQKAVQIKNKGGTISWSTL